MLAIDLRGKVIVVTGGGTGLGRAMTETFIQCGAQVAICGRRTHVVEEAAQALGPAVRPYTCDVRSWESVDAFLSQVVKDFGRLDAVVNNAAGNFLAASERLSPKGFRAVVDIVLLGTFHVSRWAGAYWIENKLPGHILNIVTTYTETGCAFVLPSAAAKAGVQALTLSLAYEWAPYGIRANAIAPGPFPTEGAWSRLMPNGDFEKEYKKRLPTGRYGNPAELGALAAFLLSDLAPYITGAVIPIDGAERLQGAMFNYLAQVADRETLKEVFERLRQVQGEKG
ncbi:MAG: SDR family oxidoreductase [Bacteroidia bacterium]|nr:SDR family oxidoreductase [Bacteroidia bacterium]MCX7763573.1 SDR family oxidoreductase [Bacteroidia bacterium]MDW8058192.1 SDR family oxidoreductase [Bacteroidia bacterium]